MTSKSVDLGIIQIRKSIKVITTKAMINPSTFYRHFKDKCDLLDILISDEIAYHDAFDEAMKQVVVYS